MEQQNSCASPLLTELQLSSHTAEVWLCNHNSEDCQHTVTLYSVPMFLCFSSPVAGCLFSNKAHFLAIIKKKRTEKKNQQNYLVIASAKKNDREYMRVRLESCLKRKCDHTLGLGETINGYLLPIYILCHNRLWFCSHNLLLSEICGMQGDIFCRISLEWQSLTATTLSLRLLTIVG